MKPIRYLRMALAVGGLLMFTGCGGGGSNISSMPSSTQDAAQGAFAVTLRFAAPPAGSRSRVAPAHSRNIIMPPPTPAYAGNIPYGALSVRIVVTDPATGAELAPARLVTRPATTNGILPLVTVQYPALRAGPVKVDVAALPNDDGAGSALATGSATGQIVAQTTTTLMAPMTLTIDHITLSTKSILLDVDSNSATFDAIPMDKNNQPLDYSLQFVSADPDIVSVFSLGGNGFQVIRNPVRGTSEILVYEPNSGLSAIVSINNQ